MSEEEGAADGNPVPGTTPDEIERLKDKISEKLMKTVSDIQEQNCIDQNNMLMETAIGGKMDHPKSLIKTNTKTYMKTMEAVRQGNATAIKAICPSEVGPNDLLNANGSTILLEYIQQHAWSTMSVEGVVAVIRYLSEVGADVNLRNTSKMTALDVLCQRYPSIKDWQRPFRFMEELIACGADVNLGYGPTSFSTLYWAISGLGFLPELSDFLLSHGARVDVGEDLGGNLFHALFNAAAPHRFRKTTDDDTLMAILLPWIKAYPAGITKVDDYENTPFHIAVRTYGHSPRLLKVLLEHNCDPNLTNAANQTPYHLALDCAKKNIPGAQHAASYLRPFAAPPLIGSSKIELEVLDPSSWKEIGIGSFGRVYCARYEAIRADVAVKELKPSETVLYRFQRAEFQREIAELHTARCNAVLTFFGFGVNSVTNALYMITELCVGSLDKVLRKSGPATPKVFLGVTTQIGKALLYLHANERCHYDIAARNVLVSRDGSWKLGDFGLACRVDEIRPKIAILWAPPEALAVKPDTRKATTGYDVWSFGVLMWELFSGGRHPYYYLNKTQKEVWGFVQNGGILDRPEHCPQEMWDSIVLPCFKNAGSRSSVEGVLETIEDTHWDVNKPNQNSFDDTTLSHEERLQRALQREATPHHQKPPSYDWPAEYGPTEPLKSTHPYYQGYDAPDEIDYYHLQSEKQNVYSEEEYAVYPYTRYEPTEYDPAVYRYY
eukprot:TRINITY_DN18410_c0_g1_i1.p1 TRINITY_DN18410_c0_g1~~TRINITY_DN18410_c0_g1_i1.p1  ORF type:complete len:735 (+),score=131.71 TRINITY_DN18410_c0_g1_i1:45-2207(+)